MLDWSEKHREQQPNVKVVTMWFVFTWNEYIELKRGLEVYVKGKEYKVLNYGNFDTLDNPKSMTMPVRVDLQEI